MDYNRRKSPNKRMKNILVTGGAGFIGSNFIHRILAECQADHISNIDALTYAGNLDNLLEIQNNPHYHFYQCDICEAERISDLLRQYSVDSVVHFAAESHVDRSIKSPMQFIQTNIVGTANLLRNCLAYWENLDSRKQKDFRFLHISTDEVFGSLKKDGTPFSECTPYAPNSPYAASKAASDHLVRAYFHTYQFPALITNCSNNYGPYQFPEKLIPVVILNAKQGQPIPVYGDGLQIRDWLYVNDHCQALLAVLKKGRVGETYNIGGNNQPTNLEIIEKICAILDTLLPKSPFKPHKQLIKFVEDRPGHDRRYAMDITKIKTEIGWQPREDLDSGLEKTVRWYLENQKWVEKITQKTDYHHWIKSNYSQRGASSR